MTQVLSNAELLAEIAKLREQNDKLREAKVQPLNLKVSEKGAISIYGMGRFPVTLYRGQCERLIGLVKSGRLEEFIQANAERLAVKGQA